ncbi:hypothetical protein NX059_000380 [Plenodomus lindquistii]|nr:hypothetical protein NX059_000380 [Plenodomus lindquistii]
MSADLTPTNNPHRAAHNRSASVGADPYHDVSRTAAESMRRTWVYNNAPAEKLPDDMKDTWRRDKPTSVAALRQGFESSSNNLLSSPKFPPRTTRLALSEIKTISVGPFRETPPSPYHEAPRKDQTDYNYGINRLLLEGDGNIGDKNVAKTSHDILPDLELTPGIVVQPMPPIPDDQISYVGTDVSDEDGEKPEDGIPAYLKKQDRYKTKMRLIQLRTLLMRCQALQSTMNNVERKPWTLSKTNQPYTHYSKMRTIAYKARELAERLQSRELQARCEYWTGRGHGGTQDFESAAEHFRLAIKLDVKNGTFRNGKPMLRGLRPREKDDVRFLLEYAEQQEQEWQRKTEDKRRAARIVAEGTNLPYEQFLDWGTIQKPVWLPDRARIMSGVAQAKVAPSLKTTLRAFRDASFEADQQYLEALHAKELERRVLSGAEKRYIFHDREKQKERRKPAEIAVRHVSEPPVSKSSSTTGSSTPSVLSPTSTASRASAGKPLNLADELEGLTEGWDSDDQSSEA